MVTRPIGGGSVLVENFEKRDNYSKKGVDNLFDVMYTVAIETKEVNKMNAGAIVKKILDEVGISQKKLATKIGIKTQQGVFNMINAKQGMRIDNFVKIMDVLGYEVLVRNKVTDEMIVVEAGKEE